jgi:DNA polymerase-3 subunit alpha
MGKKQIEVLNKMKAQFMDGCSANGHDSKISEKVWTDWEAFAQYAFNKSHSTCYAFVAYQTAYLKANYPSEYMAAVLNNQNNIEKISFFMEECKQMGISVLGPDINESELSFTVNKKGEVRFGMSGMKGVGDKAVESIVEERTENGLYQSMYDFARRSNSRAVSKKVYENLVYGGAFDCFGHNRSSFFFKPDGSFYNGIERLIKYSNDFQNSLNSSQASLFGGTNDAEISEPQMPDCEEWGLIEKLKYEKESIGIYLTGHPLDNYKFELDHFCSHQVRHLSLVNRMKGTEIYPEDQEEFKKISNRDLIIGGLVSACRHGTTKTGKPFGTFMFEDYGETFEIALFGEDYIKLKQYLELGLFLQVRGLVTERFKQKDNWEFKVNSIVLLSELRDKMSKSLTIQVPLTELSNTFINKMDEIIRLNTEQNENRNCQLKFMVMDYEEETILEMPSKTVRINPSNEFLNEISKMIGVRYKLN